MITHGAIAWAGCAVSDFRVEATKAKVAGNPQGMRRRRGKKVVVPRHAPTTPTRVVDGNSTIVREAAHAPPGSARTWVHGRSLAVSFSDRFPLQVPRLTRGAPFPDPLDAVEFSNAHAVFDTAEMSPHPCNRTIHVINLATRRDRWRHVEKVAEGMETFKVVRFDAIRPGPRHAELGGWYGCAQSHIALIRQASARKWPFVIVAEDDFVPTIDTPRWERRLSGVVAWLKEHPDEWTLFNSLPLGPAFGCVTKVLSRERGVVRVNGGQNTHFMIYNASFYDDAIRVWDTLLRSVRHRPAGIDRFLAFDLFASDRSRGMMATAFPPITRGAFDDSDISGDVRMQTTHHREEIKLMWRRNTRVHEATPFGRVPLDPASDVTVVVTSCGRWNTLFVTLSSFHEVNTHPVREVLVAEDSGLPWMADRIRETFPWVTLLYDGERKGQRARVEELWGRVETPYVFHAEDDWAFTKGFFIEQSKRVLDGDRKVLNVWLRDLDDTNRHPVEFPLHESGGVQHWRLAVGYEGKWGGFTWNPTLYRREDVLPLLESIPVEAGPLSFESAISLEMIGRGFRSAIIPGGYVVHLGDRSALSALFREAQSA